MSVPMLEFISDALNWQGVEIEPHVGAWSNPDKARGTAACYNLRAFDNHYYRFSPFDGIDPSLPFSESKIALNSIIVLEQGRIAVNGKSLDDLAKTDKADYKVDTVYTTIVRPGGPVTPPNWISISERDYREIRTTSTNRVIGRNLLNEGQTLRLTPRAWYSERSGRLILRARRISAYAIPRAANQPPADKR